MCIIQKRDLTTAFSDVKDTKYPIAKIKALAGTPKQLPEAHPLPVEVVFTPAKKATVLSRK